jgi:hypothetical protein
MRCVIRAIQTLLLFVFVFGLFSLTMMIFAWNWMPGLTAAFVAGVLASAVAWRLERYLPSSN